MKKLALFFALLLAALFTACDNDLQLAADWKDIPIVYGFMNRADTAHYIRVEKAFLDPDGNAFQTAQIVDSLYYPVEQITVQLENLQTGKLVTLQRVDGAAEGYPRDPGVFANMPNYLYKVKATDFPLEGEQEVRFILNRGGNLNPVTAEAVVLAEIEPLSSITPGSKIDFPTDREATFRFRGGEEARIFDLKLLLHYFEREIANPSNVTEYTLEWPFATGVKASTETTTTTARVFGLNFYEFIGDNLEVKSGIERGLQSMTLVITGAGEAIDEYVSISLANTGITSSQEVPVYTNLSEGRGIFSSISESITPDLLLTDDSRDSLFFGQFTADLNFVQ